MPGQHNGAESKKDPLVYQNFDHITVDGHKRATCKHCGKERSSNVSVFEKPHLEKCLKYQKYLQDGGKKYSQAQKGTIRDYYEPTDSTAEELFALAVYTSTANFALFDTPEWSDFFNKLGFKVPDRHKLSGPLLDAAYNKIKPQVQAVADAASYIQIVSDGSSNVTKTRIENISFLTGGISYYWRNTGIGATSVGAQRTADHVRKAALEITRNNLKRWTAFSTDTCSTQRLA